MAARKREVYARVAVQLRTHDRPTEAERRCPGAMGLYAFMLLQARGESSKGDVSEAVAMASWGAPLAYRKKQLDALIAVGLVERRDGRLLVIKYAEHNDTPEVIADNREAARQRQEDKRSRDSSKPPPSNEAVTRDSAVTPAVTHASCNGDVPISSSSYDLGSDPDRDPDQPARLDQAAEDSAESGSSARYAEAYAAGISRGKGGAFGWPGTQYAEWDLGKIIKAHAKDRHKKAYRGEQLLKWIEHTAAEFASDVIVRKKAQWYSAFEPRGCLKWLNEGELAEEARRVG